MASPRLFGRDSSKQQGVEPGTSEIEDKKRGGRSETRANSAVMLDLFGDLRGRRKPVEPKSGA